jgi:hypothetical protein
MPAQNATWEGFSISLPGQDLLEGVRGALETLLVFLEIAKAILETIKAFLIDFGNPLIAILEALIALILDLFKSLQQTGLYAYYDIPDPFKDPNWKRLSGGFQAFKQRWKGSLLDVRDAKRPQPVSGVLAGGFFLFVVDADGPLAIVQLVKSVLSFFKDPTRFIAPQYPAPVHVKAIPLKPGSADPVLSIADMFSSQVTDLALEWQLPGTVPTGDVGFAGVTSQIVQNFRVPNWLIEVGYDAPTTPILIEPDPVTGQFDPGVMSKTLVNGKTTGRVIQTTTTQFTDPRNLGNTFTGQSALTDEFGDPIIKMAFYVVVDGFATFLASELGKVRFVFSNVPRDKDLYFRVRAFFGTLNTSPLANAPSATGGSYVTLNWKSPLISHQSDGSGVRYLPWPANPSSTQMSMGKPSAMIHAKLSSIPNIDVIGDLTAIFEAAFALNFHVPLPPAVQQTDSKGNPINDSRGNPIYVPQFDSAGNPLPPLTDANIGQGSMQSLAGSVAGTTFSAPTITSYADFQPDPVTNELPQMPWQTSSVKRQSKKLAIRFANLLMEQGGPMLQAFKTLMRGPMPAGPVSISWPPPGGGTPAVPNYLEQLVLSFTLVTPVPPALPANTTPAVTEAAGEVLADTSVSFATADAYSKAFNDAPTRRNILAAVNFLNSLNYQGTPPDWINVSLLDLIPWSGQILYDLIAKIQALVDAYKGVTKEISDFISMLERKINTLEQFIEYLISILNFLLNLEVGFYLLPVPFIEGDVSAWLATIDNAGGTVPPSGPSGYTAGVCIAYLAPDVTGIASAFKLLF